MIPDRQYYYFSEDDVQWAKDWVERIEKLAPRQKEKHNYLLLECGKLIELLDFIATPNAFARRQQNETQYQTLSFISDFARPNGKQLILATNADEVVRKIIGDKLRVDLSDNFEKTFHDNDKPIFDDYDKF